MIELAKNFFKTIDGVIINENNISIKDFIPKFSENKENNISTFEEADNILKEQIKPKKIIEENGLRELNQNERIEISEKTGWNEKQVDKCTINEDGIIHYKCNNEQLEGQEYKNTRVEYEKKIVEFNGLNIEVVTPKFDSKFDVKLPNDIQKLDNPIQFNECNKQLKEGILEDKELKNKFNKDQIEDIINGDTPEGYTWHHDAEVGKMQLVESKKHNAPQGGVPHTGGKSIWGGQY